LYYELKGDSERPYAEVIMNVQVKSRDKEIVFNKVVTGGRFSPFSEANPALGAALQDAARKLLTDEGFITALFTAAE